MKKKLITTIIVSIIVITGLSFYLNTKIAHHETLHDVKVIEKHDKEMEKSHKYIIKVEGMEKELKFKDKMTWNLVEVGETYDIEYEYSKAHPPTVKAIGDLEGHGGGH
ncbi:MULTISPECIES: hypothetical protein [Pontibacillus]|uniref:DUF3139 domain-containing protein n=1 Tax=Pontibacillus salipaludis TaxID=1697394 RepID=A0ABQ1QCQ9_9BACI|nr:MULTISPECIES: hypothetical protein [Pontibacillus]QSS98628.1 hypothetical protein IMZ31_10950 [Pontibacillus sp. ALD_SL1]GGD21561.1 hypothetical protein GCM10011389_31540 [Pontibacillus salipaludis]